MNLNRREFLLMGGAAVASALGCNARGPDAALEVLRFAERRNEGLERALFRASALDVASPTAVTAGAAFPTYFISKTMPTWDPALRGVWRLEVTGAVARPLSLTLDELMRQKSITQRVNHYCVEGWTAIAEWTGVRMSELARLAGATSDAQYVDFESFDSGYHESWDMERAMHPQTLIAYAKDGSVLAPSYGAPARLHTPVKLGYKCTKYLTRVVFLPHKTGGYWSDQGYEWYAGT